MYRQLRYCRHSSGYGFRLRRRLHVLASCLQPAKSSSSAQASAKIVLAHTTWLRKGGADGPGSPFAELKLTAAELDNVRWSEGVLQPI
jgi:hypothetical protein